jgi:methylmalonyl-CoA mutase
MEDDLKFASEFPAATREQWLKLVDGVLKGAPFDKKLVAQTYDGLKIQPLYPRASNASTIPARAPGAPWIIAQRVDHPDPAAANAEALHDLENGATGLTLVFAGSPGAYGYGIDSALPGLERALQGIHIEGIALDLDLAWNASNAPAHIAAIAKQRKLDPAALDLRMNFDPLGAMAATGVSLVDWKTMAPRFAGMIAEFATQGFRGPFALADGRIVHNACGS